MVNRQNPKTIISGAGLGRYYRGWLDPKKHQFSSDNNKHPKMANFSMVNGECPKRSQFSSGNKKDTKIDNSIVDNNLEGVRHLTNGSKLQDFLIFYNI